MHYIVNIVATTRLAQLIQSGEVSAWHIVVAEDVARPVVEVAYVFAVVFKVGVHYHRILRVVERELGEVGGVAVKHCVVYQVFHYPTACKT